MILRRTLAALLVAGMGATFARAGSDPEPEQRETELADAVPEPSPHPHGFRQIGRDAKYLAGRPRHWDRRSAWRLAGVAATTAGLYLLRDEIREVVEKNRGDSRSDFLQDVRNMGKGAVAPSMALVAYLSSFATRNDREKETAVLLLESWFYSGAGAWTGSYVLAAERPEDGDDIEAFDSDGHGVSLDTALAASVIRPLHRQYLRVRPEDGRGRRFWKRSALGLLYAGAALTAYQRMDQDKHWAPDVFLGAWTGLTVGKNLNRSHDATAGIPTARHELRPAGNGFVWVFRPDGRGRGRVDSPPRIWENDSVPSQGAQGDADDD